MTARSFLTVLALWTACGSAARADTGGTVTLEGKPPVLAPYNVANMPQCAKEHPRGTIPNETVVIGPKGELANVIVSIKMRDGLVLPNPLNAGGPVVIDQKGCQYIPHVVAVLRGEKLVVQNDDPFLHNVHSLPTLNNPYNTATPTKDRKGKSLDTSVEEKYTVKCDVHPWMRAWVGVMDTPYFTVTDAAGHFTLPAGLPNGDYMLVAWHEKYSSVEARLTVKNGNGDARLTFNAAVADVPALVETEKALPAGVKLSVDSTPACCEVMSSKAALMKAAMKPPTTAPAVVPPIAR